MNTSMRTRSIVAVLVVGALAPVAPAAADTGYESLNAVVPPASEPSRAEPGYESVNAVVPPASEPSRAEPGYASINAVTGPPTGESTTVSSPAGDSADGFHWGDAALGAGAAMAGLLAIGAAGLLATRRRAGMSPSTSTS
jgi:hypothetical protein